MKPQTQQISKTKAIELYKQVDDNGKKWLENEFGKDFFYDEQGSLCYEAACKKLGKNAQAELPFKKPTTKRQKKANAFIKLDILREAHGKHPGIDDRKWYPVFKMTKAGFVFSNTDYEGWGSGTAAFVGSPFVFFTSEEAADFGKNNNALYNEIL